MKPRIKSDFRLQKGRPPKTPPNIKKRWTPTLGWRFRAEIRQAGSRPLTTAWRSSRDEALRNLLDLRSRIQVAEAPHGILNLEEALRIFLERAHERGFRRGVSQPCKPETVRHYREIAATIYRVAGGESLLPSMDAQFIRDYLNRRRLEERLRCRCKEHDRKCSHLPTRPSPARLNKERLVWHLIFKTAIEAEKHPGPNPVELVDKFGETRHEARHYAAEEVGSIIMAIRAAAGNSPTAEWFADIVALLFLTGLRGGELAHVQAKHVNSKRGELVIRDGKSGPRTIPILGIHLHILKRLLKDKSKEDFLLPGASHRSRTDNLKSNCFRRWRAKVPQDLQEGFTAHAFRHSFQTQLLEQGSPVHHVKVLMGHSRSRDITDRYAHATLLHLRQSMEKAFGDIDADLGMAEEPGEGAVGG